MGKLNVEHLRQTNRGRQGEGPGRKGDKFVPRNDNQKLAKQVLHMYFGLPGLLWTSEPKINFLAYKDAPDAATLALHAFELAKKAKDHQITICNIFCCNIFGIYLSPALPYHIRKGAPIGPPVVGKLNIEHST